MTESPNHIFYAATAKPAVPRPVLLGEIEAEVCVVGGGFAGLWTARALLQRGKEVVLLEAGEIASGASGQNGGFVSAGFAARLSNIVQRVGLHHARELYDLSRQGVEIVRSATIARRKEMQTQSGRLHVLRHNDEVGLTDYAEMLARDFGHELEFWRKERVRNVLASHQYYQALHEADAFHLNPLNLARLLAKEIEEAGGRIFEHSRVLEADLGGVRKSLTTESGRVRAFDVVIAGNASVGGAFPWLAETILPIRTHVAVTAPLDSSERLAIRFPGAVSDTRRAGDYYHLAGDRLLWGGRISARRNPPRRLAKLMAKDIARVYPQLAEAKLDYVWSGVMGYAVHLMPQLGMAQPGVWVASAFGGQGLNTAAMAGELIASGIAEQDDRWKLFLSFGLVWNGGAAGRAIAQSIYWGMQIRDRIDEVQTRATERDEAAAEAGHAPGFAAHLGRRFLESRAGRFCVAVINAIKKTAAAIAFPFIWTARMIYIVALAIGRALVPLFQLIAKLIEVIARAVVKMLEAIAAIIVLAARAIAKFSVRMWRRVIVPGAKRFRKKVLVPAGRRAKAGGARLFAAGKDRVYVFGRWSAKQPGLLRDRVRDVIEERRQRADTKRALALTQEAEPTKNSQADISESAASSDVTVSEEKRKKKKPKEKDRKVEA